MAAELTIAPEAEQDPAEFVENIPFTETREYVQAVLRNAALYRQLYPTASNFLYSSYSSRQDSSKSMMSDLRRFDDKITELAVSGRFDEAEKKLLGRYEKARAAGVQSEIKFLLLSLGHLYSFKRDFRTAEEYYLQLERVYHDAPTAKYLSAFFYYCGPEDYAKALSKLQDLSLRSRGGFLTKHQFAALHLKGRVLIKLNRKHLATKTLERLTRGLRNPHPSERVRVEIELAEEMMQQKVALPQCVQFLTLAIPAIREKGYRGKAKRLLKQLRDCTM